MYTLYAMAASLYSAKLRAYLRKQAIPFRERTPAHPDFQSRVVPAVGRWIIPVLETPEGVLLQDAGAVIAHFEAEGVRLPATPPTPVHETVARILELYGGEGLLRPAMHYRWSFDAENLEFLKADFLAALAPHAPAELGAQVFEAASGRMRRAAAACGVSPESAPQIEAAYEEFLAVFEAHLAVAPCLLGGRPTLGDYGFFGSLSAHLGRDPAPLQRMQRRAPRVWRWVERMQAPDQAAAEYGDRDETLFADDSVPDTLKALLRFIAQDYLGELAAMTAFADAWLADQPQLETGTSGLTKPSQRAIGMMALPWRGLTLQVGVLPYRLWLLQRVQDVHARAEPVGQAAIRGLLEEVGLSPLLAFKTRRRVERRDNLEVWGPLQSPRAPA